MSSIVLAEDDVTMLSLLGTLLRMDGHDVTALDAGGDIVKTLRELAPDVLLLDMLFAEQNGLELVEKIRRSDIRPTLFIIMMSGLSVREDALRRGADAFLLKPFMPEELTLLLRTRLQPIP